MTETQERPTVETEWIPLAEVARILGRTPFTAQRVALATGIRVQNLPGAPRLLFSRADTERVADRAGVAVAAAC